MPSQRAMKENCQVCFYHSHFIWIALFIIHIYTLIILINLVNEFYK